MDSEDSDQTGQMPFRVFAGRSVILLVLSQGGSFIVMLTDVYNCHAHKW